MFLLLLIQKSVCLFLSPTDQQEEGDGQKRRREERRKDRTRRKGAVKFPHTWRILSSLSALLSFFLSDVILMCLLGGGFAMENIWIFYVFGGDTRSRTLKWSQRVLRPLLQDIGDGETSVFYFCWWRSDYPSCLTGSHIRHCEWNSSRIWHHTFNFIWAVEFHQIWHFWSKNLLLDLFIFNIENLISNNFHIFT